MEYKFPFRIGIIGHQSLTDAEKIYVSKEIQKSIETVQRTVENLRKKSNIKSDFFISGISTLSEGAERVFASEIINLPGVLEVVLPFRKELYIEDFWGEASKTEFQNLLTYDAYPLVIDNSHTPDKNLCYYNASKLVIEQCDVLFAIWDETPVKSKIGGVANLIEYAKQFKAPVITLLPKPRENDFEKENKKNIEAIQLSRYIEFDKKWVMALKNLRAAKSKNNATITELLKNNLPAEEFSKFTHLLQLKGLWQKESTSREGSIKSLSNVIYLLLLAAGTFALFGVFMNHTSFNIPLLQKLLPNSWINWLPKINASGIPILILALGLLLLVLILRLKANSISKKIEWDDSQFWSKKTELQLFKLLSLNCGNEPLNKNESYERFRTNSVSARLFLISTKEVWNTLKNPLDFDIRRKFLTDELLATNIQNLTKTILKLQSRQKLTKTTYSLFFSLIIVSLLWIACWFFYPGLNLTLSNYTWTIEVAQVSSLIFISLCIAIKSRTTEFDCANLSGQETDRRKTLVELEQTLPELCNSEEQLESIFAKAEETILKG